MEIQENEKQFLTYLRSMIGGQVNRPGRNRERNARVTKRVLESGPEIKSWREGFKRHHKIDPLDGTKLPVMREGFSWRKLEEKLAMREADTSSAFVQFLRAGLQQITNSMYMSVPTTYEDWVTVVSSKMDTEPYAPNHGVSFPRQIGQGELAPEVTAAALDLKIKNLDFACMYVVQKQLLDDDQSGTFQQQAGLMGEYMKLLTEVMVYGKLASVAGMQYAEYQIPVSETKPADEATYPWSTTLKGGGANRPAAYALLAQAALQNAFIGLMNQKNMQGLKMTVMPNRLVLGPRYNFDAPVLLNSAYYPTGATAGATGGAFAINPLKGLADVTISRFMFKNDGTVNGDSTAWYLVDDSKPWFVVQEREAATVTQEAPNSGASFDRRQYRFRCDARKNADHIDPRFAWQGNNGSVTV